MFYRTIFVCLVGFGLVKLVKMSPSVNITLNIQTEQSNGSSSVLTCDHNEISKEQNTYTVYEGGNFTIVTKYKKTINHIICYANNYDKITFEPVERKVIESETNFTGEKKMGTIWKCNILAHRDTAAIQTVVQYNGHEYSAAYCYMKIHVRQKEAPQTILVNNMKLPAVRTDLSQKDVDFIAEYQYAVGDEVNVICINERSNMLLTMEYEMAGTRSENSIMNELKSSKMIGFTTRLYSGHDNSSMICTHTENGDYTKVMVRFVIRTKFDNIISITINGKVLPPYLENPGNNHYRIDYKYVVSEYINMTCEIKQPDGLKDLLVFAENFEKEEKKNDTTKFEMNNFYLTGANKKLECAADYLKVGSAESVVINFSDGTFPVERYPLHMELPSNGRVMEVYNDYKRNVIFYEYEDGETLQLTCNQPRLPDSLAPPALCLEFDSKKCEGKNCSVPKTLTVTRENENIPIVCYLKEERDPSDPSASEDKVLRTIRVILRKRVLTTTSSTTTTTTTMKTTTTTNTPIVEHPAPGEISPTETLNGGQRGTAEGAWLSKNTMTKILIIGCCVVCIIIICASIVIIKLRKRNHSQAGPHNRNYENLQEPSESSIPAYPPQWENNYAVPVDRRIEDTTYSVPCPPADLYATPTPKSLRNKKQKPLDPTYAVLTVPKNRDQKNMFKETEDPNYSEVYANRPEARYAKVLPKSQRNNAEQDNPYSYVTNDRPCAFVADSEPMYCEPGKARDAEYANLNNSHYANSNPPEYVEPTYCEPQKPMK